MHNKICEFCEKPFTAKHGAMKYCSKLCRMKATGSKDLARKAIIRETKHKTKEYQKKEALCWSCKNACGGCSWSRNLKPVKGWKAKPITNKDIYVKNKSYKVIACPEFEAGR